MHEQEIKGFVSSEDLQMHKAKHRFSDEKSFDYDQITEEIFLGTNMCCLAGYSEELLIKDITGDISLEKERIDNPIGVGYFLWIPVEDNYAPTQKQIELGVETIDFFVKNKMKVYVHCKNAHGRAPTLVAAYFINKGSSVEEAIANVKLRRPSIHPNNVQVEALEKYLESLNL